MLKPRKNTIRNQFEQQWFEGISFQKPRRVYPAILYNLKPFTHKKGMTFQWAFDRESQLRKSNDVARRKIALASKRFPTKCTEQGI